MDRLRALVNESGVAELLRSTIPSSYVVPLLGLGLKNEEDARLAIFLAFAGFACVTLLMGIAVALSSGGGRADSRDQRKVRRASIEAQVEAVLASPSTEKDEEELTRFMTALGLAACLPACARFKIKRIAELALLGDDELQEVAPRGGARKLSLALHNHFKRLHRDSLTGGEDGIEDDEEEVGEGDNSADEGSVAAGSADVERETVAKNRFRGSVLETESFFAGAAAEGYLDKLSTKDKWQTRYFRLAPSQRYLLYFGSKRSASHPKSLKAAIDIRQIVELHRSATNDREISWSSKLPSGRVRDFYLRAPTKLGATKWFEALGAAVECNRIKAVEKRVEAAPAAPEQPQAPAATDTMNTEERPLSTEHFTQEERDMIVELRRRVADIFTSPSVKDDANLVRFLRARDMNIKDAEKMWRDHAAWREKFGIDERMAWAYASPPNGVPEFVRTHWPQRFLNGSDHDGVPVELCRLGMADIPGIEKSVGREAFVQCGACSNEKCFEMLREVSRRQGKVVTSCSIILDMKGLGRRHVYGVAGFGAMMSTCEPNFPERLGHIFIIRAPWIFSTLYAMVKPMLNPGTANKVVIVGDNYMPVLLRHMPEETIPRYLGGLGDASHIPAGGIVPKGAIEEMRAALA